MHSFYPDTTRLGLPVRTADQARGGARGVNESDGSVWDQKWSSGLHDSSWCRNWCQSLRKQWKAGQWILFSPLSDPQQGSTKKFRKERFVKHTASNLSLTKNHRYPSVLIRRCSLDPPSTTQRPPPAPRSALTRPGIGWDRARDVVRSVQRANTRASGRHPRNTRPRLGSYDGGETGLTSNKKLRSGRNWHRYERSDRTLLLRPFCWDPGRFRNCWDLQLTPAKVH